MKTCILTIIKNEHLYLDEWIKYHLDIGVDHLFIFEDIDSDSHKEIVSKYNEKVSLNKVSIILSDLGLKKAQEYKRTKSKNPQYIYIYKGLSYLQNNFDYDWCFAIDADEFITLENNNSNLKDILSQYITYDAIILTWQCYGANGLIYKPNYSTKGVIDIFTTPINNHMSRYYASLPMNDKKTCYNLLNFNRKDYNSNHVPKDSCNYCNTDFVKNNIIKTYKNIYIRHYLTKSWEEYVWKKKERGYFMGFARSFDVFFKLNPDMIDMKEELLRNV